MNNNQIRSW